jgi:hypothetical protein
LVRLNLSACLPSNVIIAAVAITFIPSVLGVCALGETDINPVSKIGNVSELVLALIISAGIHKLYTRVYEIPGPFQIPTAQVSINPSI